MRRLLSVLLVTSSAACSPVKILNAMAPSGGVSIHAGLPYRSAADLASSDPAIGSTSGLALDVYAPIPGCGHAPVVVFFFGGGWEAGDRGMYRFLGAALAKRGVVAVIPNYRLYPQVRFPTFMQDAASAVAWTRDHIAQYGGDPDHLFLMGHSAGGQIATLLALDTQYLQAAGVDPTLIAGVIGLSGPYDFLPLTDPTLKAIFGPPDAWKLSQPIDYVTSAAPPMLLATGTADQTVRPANTTRLADRLRKDGVAVDERYYQGVGHEVVIGSFASVLSFLTPARRDTLDFITAHHAACPSPGMS